MTIIYAVNIACAYVILKLGMSPEALYGLLIFFKVIVFITQLILGRRMFALPLSVYIRSMLRYVLPVLALGIILIFIPCHLFDNIIARMASSIVIVETILLSSVMLIGLENNERAFIYNKVKEITKKIKK